MRYIKMDLIGGQVYAKVVDVANRTTWGNHPLQEGWTIEVEFDNGAREYYNFDNEHFEEVTQREYEVGKVMAS